ncbi:haloalkanoic acid dehalogenase [Coniophora puteana RWD-64-598 SS2]|uniref:Haloalkanoic acid dehalogenase n=1 Tax=Coniophora puteana (strain RWD-64-598) TaxID=741705 RepID=A0A5M3MHG5_CONPW|nr:haloalkanoic acid dehalogenase [Coniophora puteana RWD-64-598 SS2]EIW78497.1 haloalkanoic acid dehalogenase [Coniophora puteana RWD-64-598 SS2]
MVHTPTPTDRLLTYEYIIFDVYGTLVDWESPIYNSLNGFFEDRSLDAVLTAYQSAETDLAAANPNMRYPEILTEVYRRLSQHNTGPPPDTQSDDQPRTDPAERFGNSVGDWEPFPDTLEGLKILRQRYHLVALSNVDNDSFARTIDKLQKPFDLVVTAQEQGVYKPDPEALNGAMRRIVDELKSKVLVVAGSYTHDIQPAQAHKRDGMGTVWIDRKDAVIGQPDETLRRQENPPWDWTYTTLGELAKVVEAKKPIRSV